ncbi:MAG: DUF4230 domain-containing protein [Streptosporangiales bacterium]|nr:DUF4230 domain-containing protein [Streptosporangiales bacterium]
MTRTEHGARGQATRRRRRPGLWGLLTALVVLALAVSVLRTFDVLPRLTNPFADREVDRGAPAVLKSVRDISRYEAATGEFQVIVDLERDARFVPDAIRGERTLYVATGGVDAYVDFSRLAGDAVSVSADRRAVEVTLPRAALEKPNLDPARSYVFARERGLVDRVEDFFDDSPTDDRRMTVLAEGKIAAAAEASGLTTRAEQNTRVMLERLLRSLGYTRVTVRTADGR